MERPDRYERTTQRPTTRDRSLEARRAALAVADRLLRETVAATAAIEGESGREVGRLLREVAASALARLACACREPRDRRALRALDGTRHLLDRLGTWLDLAERFGDLTPGAAEALGRARTDLGDRLEELAAAWRRDAAHRARASADDLAEVPATIELQVPPPGGVYPGDTRSAAGRDRNRSSPPSRPPSARSSSPLSASRQCEGASSGSGRVRSSASRCSSSSSRRETPRARAGAPRRPVAGAPPARRTSTELVFYELHVGTFSSEGTFAGVVAPSPARSVPGAA